MQIELKELRSYDEMLAQFPLIQQLNGQYTYESYAALLRAMCDQGNYFQVAAFEGDRCLGLTGIWIGTQLWCGKFIEVDNFVVDAAHRGSGVGKKLLEWVEERAKKENCKSIRLDTYVVLDKAQRFYFSQGFRIIGFHMIKDL